MKFMFDTNAYNKLLDENIEIISLKGEFFTTHIPKDELNDTKKEEIRKALNEKFKEISQIDIPAESFLLSGDGISYSRLNQAKLSDVIIFNKILSDLNLIKPQQEENNKKDALIGETSIKNNLILVTDDKALLYAVSSKEIKGKCLNFLTFLEIIK